jgi:bifunctional non-homologous end joining protein LigD
MAKRAERSHQGTDPGDPAPGEPASGRGHRPVQHGSTTIAQIKGAVRAPLPAKLVPQLSQLVEQSPKGSEWLSEIKFDGYRLLVFLDHGRVRLFSRNGLDWTDRVPELSRSAAEIAAETALLDGELVALRSDGVSSFPDLQEALSTGKDASVFYYAFDLLYLDGWDLRRCALVDRKAALSELTDWKTGMLRYSDHVAGEGEAMFRRACAMGLEGIVCKRADAPYRPGRSGAWVKVKCRNREEFVVLGWTPPKGHRVGIGSLHVGYFDEGGALHYAGGVGTGFSDRELARLRDLLGRIRQPGPERLLYAGDPVDRAIQWVRPAVVIEVEFAGWSGSGRLRHASYLGVREDKSPTEVVRSVADPQAVRVELGATSK